MTTPIGFNEKDCTDELYAVGSQEASQANSRPLSSIETRTEQAAQAVITEIDNSPSSLGIDPDRITPAPAGAEDVPSPVQDDISMSEDIDLEEDDSSAPVDIEEPEESVPVAPIELPSLEDVNFVVRVRELVAQLLAQLSRISENDRKQVETLKKEYRTSAQKAADMQVNMGWSGVAVAALAFAVNLSQFMISNPNINTQKADREIIQFLAGQIPTAGNLFRDRYQAKQMEFGAVRDLRNQEIQMKNSKTQSESGSKQEILQLLTTALQLLKGASDRN